MTRTTSEEKKVYYEGIVKQCRTSHEVTGSQALDIRDAWERCIAWESYVPSHLPTFFRTLLIWILTYLRRPCSLTLTYMTGLAPRSDFDHEEAGVPKRSVRWWLWRHIVYTGTVIAASLATIKIAPGFEKLLGVPLIWYSMRSLQAGFGHVLSHLNGETWADKALRLSYELLQGALAGGCLALYKVLHKFHHSKTGRAADPDVQFLYGRLRCDFSSAWACLWSLLSCHALPLWAGDRAKVLLGIVPAELRAVTKKKVRVPLLRVIYNLLVLGGLAWWLWPWGALIYFCAVFPGYQVCALAGMACLHSWQAAVEGIDARSEALSVTINRLNLPQPSLWGVGELVFGWVVYCLLFPQDRFHEGHHAGHKKSMGPLTPWTHTRLIMAGEPTRQTVTVKRMFAANFEANRRNLGTNKMVPGTSRLSATHI